MAEALANLADWELAWRRVKKDEESGQTFVRRPFEARLIELDLESWLVPLADEVRNRRYAPSPMRGWPVPKVDGSVRPGGILTMADRVVYAACVSACLPQIHPALLWPDGPRDFSQQLSDRIDDVDWVRQPFTWHDFHNDTLSRVRTGAPYLLTIDIAAYADHIDHAILLSELKEIGAPSYAVEQLGACLARWAQVPGMGIPQGHGASDILYMLYLHPIDRRLRESGYTHSRCLDEFRIFCRRRADAEKAMADLSQLLSERKLTPNLSKSSIARAGGMRWYLPNVFPNIWKRHERRIPRIVSLALARLWLWLSLRFRYVGHLSGILDIFEGYNDPSAARHCDSLLRSYPHQRDTLRILRYCESVNATAAVGDGVVALFKSGDTVHSHQIYRIIEWLCRPAAGRPSQTLLSLIRGLALEESQPSHVRSIARKFLAEHGSAADLELLAHSYSQAADPLDQSEIICCLKRMEAPRRELFLERAERDGEWTRRAVRFVRNTATPTS